MIRKTLILAICSGIFLFLSSGIIRHDKPESAYTELAAQSQFDCVAMIYKDTTFSGSCVLIDETHVLSASHVFRESEYRLDTMKFNGQEIVSYTPVNTRTIEAERLSIHFKGEIFKVKDLVLQPNYLDSASKGNCDIAILTLAEPVKNIKPAMLYNGEKELHAKVTGVGYGVDGVASKPETVKPHHRKIAGENVIDKIGGYKFNGMPTIMSCDFDHPDNKKCNKMGSKKPLPLEYMCGGGDSGGGLFIHKGDHWELIGICSGSSLNIQQLLKTGYYGQVMNWTRVSAFKKWISETVKQ